MLQVFFLKEIIFPEDNWLSTFLKKTTSWTTFARFVTKSIWQEVGTWKWKYIFDKIYVDWEWLTTVKSYRTVCHGGADHLHYIIKGTDLYSITILYNLIEQKPLYISPSIFNFLNPNSFWWFIYIFQPLGSDFSNWNLRRLVAKVVYATLIVIFMVY